MVELVDSRRRIASPRPWERRAEQSAKMESREREREAPLSFSFDSTVLKGFSFSLFRFRGAISRMQKPSIRKLGYKVLHIDYCL